MPGIVNQSITIISNGGVGMAMFSLGMSKNFIIKNREILK